MTTAAAAAEYRSNVGQDYSLLDGLDEQYLDTSEEDEETERQRVNRKMYDWFYGC